MTSQDLRNYAMSNLQRMYKVAEQMGISEQTLHVKLRKPITDEFANDFIDAVDKLKEEK